ncbi:hypothetical protein JCM13304A_23450 [Desulfothermus okinawensis JCM 13304]
MQIESIDFNEFKPIIHDIVKEFLEEEKRKQKELPEIPRISIYELFERVVKIEEELKHQREMIRIILEQMDKRFEQIDKRFEQIDKRFEQIDKRFEQIDKRFEQVDKRFEQITTRLDRFMFWTLGLVLSATLTIIGYLHYFIR